MQSDLWKICRHKHGIFLPESGLWLDPRARKPLAFVSHAHSDHIAAHAHVILTEATARFLQVRLPDNQRTKTVLSYFEPFSLPDGPLLTLYPAGHIPGSAQMHLQFDGKSLLYSGDFTLRHSAVAEPCHPVEADVLIMETTFGLPGFVFPPTETVIQDIIHFCHQSLREKRVPVLLAYSLGKAQEVLAALAGSNLPVMLHDRAFQMTRICEDLGWKFPEYKKITYESAKGHVLIVPPGALSGRLLQLLPPCRTAAITGWALDRNARYRYSCDALFPLSAHAGFDELLRYVERVNPKEIYTVHGYAAEFAAILRRQGRTAWSLAGNDQLELGLGHPL